MLLTPIHGEPFTSGPDQGLDTNPQKLKVTVVFTSIEGTIAALAAAAAYANALAAEIVICVPHVVYFRYPLERPPVAPAYFEKLCRALIDEANLDPYTIAIDIRYCRSQLSCLSTHLKPHSLVILGAERTWWYQREKRLASALGQLGHDVVFVYAPRGAARSHSLSVTQRMLA